MDKPNNNAEKQFMIGRIQYSLNNFIEDWHYQTKSFEELIENTFSTNKRERNAILSACGIFIPILFGLSSIEKINTESLEFYLILDAVIGISVFALYGIYNLLMTKLFFEIQGSFNTTIAHLNALRGSFGVISFEISDTPESELRTIFYLARIVNGSGRIRVGNELIRASNKKRLHPELKNEFRRVANEWTPDIDTSKKIYETFKDELNKKNWENFQFLIQPIKDYKK